MNSQPLDLFPLITGSIGGLALFLYGLDKMGNALKLISSFRLKKIMTNLTKNRILSLFTGTVLTALVQSSSATTVLLVGFVSAEMLTLRQALGVILGADIGTTITVQLIAFKVTKYALVPVALGFFIKALSKEESLQNLGRTLLGVGLLFYGIDLMSVSMQPLRTHQPFIDMMTQMSNPLYAIWFGALFTAAVQSSAATLAIIVALASQGLIDIKSGIGLMLGANIGTCITAGLACIGKNRAAQRTAAAHVSFKIVGALLILPFLTEFESVVRFVYPTENSTMANPRDIANAHLLFNIFIAMVFLPFIPQIAKILQKLIPEKKVSSHMTVKYITNSADDTPTSIALATARREIYRMGIYVEKMIEQSLPAILNKDKKALNKINKDDEFIDYLYQQITNYLIEISKKELTTAQSEELVNLTQIVNDLESIGDLLERDVVDLGKKFIEEEMSFNEDLTESAEKTFNTIKQVYSLTLMSINDPSKLVLDEINSKKAYISRLVNKVNSDKLTLKLSKDNLKYHSLCNDLVDTFARIFYYNRKIARNLLTQENKND